jgi:hypothetical protein
MKAQAGVTVNANDTFDVLKSATFINNSGMTVKSEINGIDFVPSMSRLLMLMFFVFGRSSCTKMR